MIKFKTDLKTFEIPIGWHELKFTDYEKLVGATEIEALKILTGLNDVELCMIDIDSIVPYLEFLKEDISLIEPIDSEIEVGQESYEKKIVACSDLGNIRLVIETYRCEIEEWERCNEIFGVYNHISKQLFELIERDNERLKPNISIEQKQAGIDSFNELGEFNTIDMIAEKYNYTHKEVEQLPYNLIFLILLKQNISTKFEDNYRKIISNDN
jgi:hypothetical protein